MHPSRRVCRCGLARRARLVVAVLSVLGASSVWVPSSVVQADSAAEQAAREIADARERANEAADAYFRAEEALDGLALEEQALQAQVADLQAQVDALAGRVQSIALRRYTRSATVTSPLFNGFNTPEEQMQIAALSEVVADTSAEDFDEYELLTSDLESRRAALGRTQQRAEQARRDAAELRDRATAEVERLKEVEAQRLADEAVRNALAAEEAARRAKEAQQRPADRGDDGTDSGPVSGGGGQTGGGGSGGEAGGGRSVDHGGPGWVCPTGRSPVAFGDTWGAPRSGGRRHQGVDMIGATGTPLLAVVDGFAEARTNELGGTTIWFSGADGNKYYYAHLDRYGTLGAVRAGDVIGYMGQTGNARDSVPHLHFEIHPGGGAAVNPYPTVRAHC